MDFEDFVTPDAPKKEKKAHTLIARSKRNLTKKVNAAEKAAASRTIDTVEARRQKRLAKEASEEREGRIEKSDIMSDFSIDIYKLKPRNTKKTFVPDEEDEEIIEAPLSARSVKHRKIMEEGEYRNNPEEKKKNRTSVTRLMQQAELEEEEDPPEAEPTELVEVVQAKTPEKKAEKRPVGRPRKQVDPNDLGDEDSRSARKKSQRLMEEIAEAESNPPSNVSIGNNVPANQNALAFSGEVALRSIFKDKAGEILQMLDDGNQDGALTITMKTLMHTLLEVLPKIENAVHASGGTKGVYQLTQAISQVRELCADIQAFRDKANLGQQMVDRFVRPSFIDIGTQIMQAWVELEAQVQTTMTPKEFEDFKENYTLATRRSLALYITRKFEEVSKALIQSLT